MPDIHRCNLADPRAGAPGQSPRALSDNSGIAITEFVDLGITAQTANTVVAGRQGPHVTARAA